MKQPIAGVTPPELREATVMTVWPSLAATATGRFLGRLYEIELGVPPLTVGHLIAVASIPLVVVLYFGRFISELMRATPVVGKLLILPPGAQRYVLTNRRVVVRAGLTREDQRWVALNRFDSITIDVRPGQAFYRAGDLVFRLGAIETFRLSGVVRPDTFRHTCLEARQGYLGAEQSSDR
jgi:hypothetical protein